MNDNLTPKLAPWLRVLQFPLVRLILLGPLLFLMMGISNGFWGVAYANEPLKAIGMAALMSVLACAVYAAFVRFVEQRPVHELALHAMGRELGFGMLLGAGLYTLCVLVLMLFGVYRIEAANPFVMLLPAVAMALSSGVFEELLHRGTLFRNVEEAFGSWIALFASALFFGLRHLSNADGNLIGALAITIEAGLLLAAAYMLTRRLWLSIGFHISWNFTQGGIFSGSVSGAFERPGLIKATIQGPDWLTGDKFGMEASLVAFLICTTTGLVMLIMAIRRGNIMPPLWKRAG